MARLANPSDEPKVSRAIRLDKELDDQLVLVCKTLGVNPNAYLRQVVGEAINKHLSQYRIEQGLINSVTAQMEKMFALMAAQEQEQSQDKSNSD
jgi:predicted DNA-binding protein